MTRLAYAALALALVPGCLLFFDDGGKGGHKCDGPQVGGGGSGGSDDDDAPDVPDPSELTIAEQRNPQTLTCEAHGGGPPTCNPACGPCPETTTGGDRGDLAPLPTWGFCGDACELLAESACAADPSCRVVKDAFCTIAGDCLTDFLGCFPLDMVPDDTVDCFTADAFTCSRNRACTAVHRNNGCADGIGCEREFALCMPEGATPGQCAGTVACRALPPSCPPGTTPGISNSCWTGACIPTDLCE